MFQSIEDFVSMWKAENERTKTLFQSLTSESLHFRPNPNVRSIRHLCGHLIKTPKELLERTGLVIEGLDDKAPSPNDVQELVQALEKTSEDVTKAIQTHWTNEDLEKTDAMYGETWTRRQSLSVLLVHMIHHRGQLTTLMRLFGLKVLGMYGPSKEEWKMYGLEEPSDGE